MSIVHYLYTCFTMGGSRGRVQGVRTPEMSCGVLIQLVFCKKQTNKRTSEQNMCLIGAKEKHETRLKNLCYGSS